MSLISFVIPCYNSSKSLGTVIDEILSTVSQKPEYQCEIVLVNDNSSDNTYEVMKQLAVLYGNVVAVDLSRNFGQHCALMAGYSMVHGDIVVSLDDDGQTPANEVFSLISKLDEGYDIVFAEYKTKKHNIFRNFGSMLNDVMAKTLINKPKNLYLSSYFAAKKFIVYEMRKYSNSYPYISGLLLRTTNRIANVVVNHRNRESGASGYTFKKLLTLWMNGFTAFSVKPLRIASFMGGIFAGLGFLYVLWIIINKFLYQAAPLGYSSTMAVLLFIGGILMLMLGMIGEYIGRIYISINNAPQYVIREVFKNGVDIDE